MHHQKHASEPVVKKAVCNLRPHNFQFLIELLMRYPFPFAALGKNPT